MTVEAKLSHDVKFVDETLFTVFTIEAALLREGFNSEFSFIGESFYFINRSKISFTEFFERFEHFMEAFSIDLFGKAEDPAFNDVKVWRVEAKGFDLIVEQSDTDFCGEDIVLNSKKGT